MGMAVAHPVAYVEVTAHNNERRFSMVATVQTVGLPSRILPVYGNGQNLSVLQAALADVRALKRDVAKSEADIQEAQAAPPATPSVPARQTRTVRRPTTAID